MEVLFLAIVIFGGIGFLLIKLWDLSGDGLDWLVDRDAKRGREREKRKNQKR